MLGFMDKFKLKMQFSSHNQYQNFLSTNRLLRLTVAEPITQQQKILDTNTNM